MAKARATVRATETVPEKPRLPVVEQPASGKREVAVDPPIAVRLLANSAPGKVICADAAPRSSRRAR